MSAIIRSAVCALALSLMSLPAVAGQPLFSLTAGGWKYKTDEDIRDNSSAAFASDSDVSLDDGEDAFYALTLRPPTGLLPALTLRYINLQLDGNARTSASAGGIGGVIGGGSTSDQDIDADVDDLELAAVYNFDLPAGFGIDLGASVKRLDGDITARNRNTGARDKRKIDITFPLLIGGLRYRFADWLGAHASYRGISAGGDSASELRASLDLSPLSWLTLSAGYWRKNVDAEDDNLAIDMQLDGPFVSLTAGL